MSKTLDVYRDWLGIQEAARPLNYYQLLRLKRFEDNPAKIRENYRKLCAHVRKLSSGEHGKRAEALVGELAKAVMCLTDSRRKREYDQALGRANATDGQARTLDQILLGAGAITPEQLAKAQQFSRVVGVELHDALIQQKAASPEVVISAYAESIGTPFLDVAEIPLDETLARQVPAMLARQYSVVPIMLDENQLLIASPHLLDPSLEEQLRMRTGKTVRTVLCTAAGVNALINKHYSKELAAAEMASGPGAAPSANKGKGGAADEAKAEDSKPKLTREEAAKQRLQYSFVAGNLAVMAFAAVYCGLFDYSLTLLILGGTLFWGAAFGITWTRMKP